MDGCHRIDTFASMSRQSSSCVCMQTLVSNLNGVVSLCGSASERLEATSHGGNGFTDAPFVKAVEIT